MEFSDLLVKEHEPIRRALDVLRIMTGRVESGAWPDRHDVNALLLFLHYFADVCHQGKEESILLPAIQAGRDRGSPVEASHFMEEHHESRSLIEETQLMLFTDKDREFVATARNLIDLIARHAEEEEAVLFPFAEKSLTPEQDAELTAKMQHADARFGRTQKRLLIEMLDQLERKYLPEAA